MNNNFKDIRITDNFYQSSSFFPMPLTLIGTLNEDKTLTSFGSYSLIFPYYIAGKKYYAMILECRNTSNTAKGLLRHGKCTINFLPYSKKNFQQHVNCGFPGDTPEEKMKDCWFELEKGQAEGERPLILKDAYQVFECTWDDKLEDAYKDKKHLGELEGVEGPYRNFNGITSKYGCHFILKIDKILLKEKYANAILNGAKRSSFPKVPVDYGYRDSKNFWYARAKTPISEPIAASNAGSVESVMYCADRLDDKIKFTKDACAMLVKIPRVFMKAALMQIVEYARKENIELITPEVVTKFNEIRKKRQ